MTSHMRQRLLEEWESGCSVVGCERLTVLEENVKGPSVTRLSRGHDPFCMVTEAAEISTLVRFQWKK